MSFSSISSNVSTLIPPPPPPPPPTTSLGILAYLDNSIWCICCLALFYIMFHQTKARYYINHQPDIPPSPDPPSGVTIQKNQIAPSQEQKQSKSHKPSQSHKQQHEIEMSRSPVRITTNRHVMIPKQRPVTTRDTYLPDLIHYIVCICTILFPFHLLGWSTRYYAQIGPGTTCHGCDTGSTTWILNVINLITAHLRAILITAGWTKTGYLAADCMFLSIRNMGTPTWLRWCYILMFSSYVVSEFISCTMFMVLNVEWPDLIVRIVHGILCTYLVCIFTISIFYATYLLKLGNYELDMNAEGLIICRKRIRELIRNACIAWGAEIVLVIYIVLHVKDVVSHPTQTWLATSYSLQYIDYLEIALCFWWRWYFWTSLPKSNSEQQPQSIPEQSQSQPSKIEPTPQHTPHTLERPFTTPVTLASAPSLSLLTSPTPVLATSSTEHSADSTPRNGVENV